jgi:exopolysaccharide biosynthesis polyprenyl glycosylphosphotransferase
MLRERAKLLERALMAFDLGTAAAAFLVAARIAWPEARVRELVGSPQFLVTPCLLLAALHWLGAYRSFRVSALREEFRLIFAALLLSGAGRLVAAWVAQHDLPARTELFLFLLLLLVVLFGSRIGLRLALRQLRRHGYNVRYFLIAGTGARACEVREAMTSQEYWGIRILGHVETGPHATGNSGSRDDMDVLGDISELNTILQRYVVDAVFFVVEELGQHALQNALACCRRLGVQALVDLHPFEQSGHLQLSEFASSPLLVIQQTRLEGPRAFFKRVFDIAAAAVGLLAVAPLMLAIAISIKLNSSGPVMFRQRRVGMHGRLFTMLKFRTMVDGAEALRDQFAPKNEMDGPVFKLRHDPRVTQVGRWLRRLSLDELPQLWNVLAGHMSMVGPRPPLPHEVEQYESWQRRRLSVRPGLTCLWQVSGRNDLSFERWVKLDLDYIDNWSWWLDLKILWRTLPAMVRGQ